MHTYNKHLYFKTIFKPNLHFILATKSTDFLKQLFREFIQSLNHKITKL